MVDHNLYSENRFNSYDFPKANPRHRLAGYFLESGLVLVTFGIGWVIWSIVLWANGQTPAKQILKMRVMDAKSHRPASWGQMAIRQLLLPMVPATLIWISLGSWLIHFGSSYPSVVPYGSYLIALVLLYIVAAAYAATDAFWILRADKRRLTDYWASTYVVNVAAPAQNFDSNPAATF